MWLRACGKAGDLVAGEQAGLAGEAAGGADHTHHRGGAGILRREAPRRIQRGLAQVPDGQVIVAFVEDLGPVGNVGGVGFAPVNVQGLALLPDDFRDADPDGRRATSGIPCFDLMRQDVALVVGEAEVFPMWFGLGKWEPFAL